MSCKCASCGSPTVCKPIIFYYQHILLSHQVTTQRGLHNFSNALANFANKCSTRNCFSIHIACLFCWKKLNSRKKMEQPCTDENVLVYVQTILLFYLILFFCTKEDHLKNVANQTSLQPIDFYYGQKKNNTIRHSSKCLLLSHIQVWNNTVYIVL